MDHLDSLLQLKQNRIDELQKQLDRKQARRKEAEAYQNSLQVPFETVPSPVAPIINETPSNMLIKTPSAKSLEAKVSKEESKIPVKTLATTKSVTISKQILPEVSGKELTKDLIENVINLGTSKLSYTKFPAKTDSNKLITFVEADENKKQVNEIITNYKEVDVEVDVDIIKSEVFKEIEIIDERVQEYEDFKDSEPENITTIGQTIQNEVENISHPIEYIPNLSC